jgi:hypothetical protein
MRVSAYLQFDRERIYARRLLGAEAIASGGHEVVAHGDSLGLVNAMLDDVAA